MADSPLPAFPESAVVVRSFAELVSTPFTGGVNAICWRRSLAGDFDEVVAACGAVDEITGLEANDLLSLSLSPAGVIARDQLIADLRLLRDQGLDPSLDLIPTYPKDAEDSIVPIDVYDFHADSATTLADTFLCSYTVAASEGVANADAVRRVDIPKVRASLLAEYGGADDADFAAFLAEHCYDLHYLARPEARPFSFGFGNLWRIATQCPGSPVPPCIHRAPTTGAGDPPRLLLIS